MIEQIIIALCGITSVYLSQDPRRSWARWACIAGLISEPFWLMAAYKAGQWGVGVMAVVYTFGWGRGYYYHWIVPRRERKEP